MKHLKASWIPFLFIPCLNLPVPQQIRAEEKIKIIDEHFIHNTQSAYMGVGSCSSSNCHGSVSPRKASNVLQNEYVTWEKHDVHSKAWVNLSNEDSVKIAKNLGIESAEKEPLCLKCHATYLENDARQSGNFQIQDGVGCESCHGAAEKYLGPHTAKDATHARNIENGMLDIVSPEQRIRLCATCHFGTDDKYVDHRLMGAGHPRLSFELDTFSMIQPKHWIVDEDYVSRKSDYNSAKAWLIGQVYLSEKTLDRLGSEKLSKSGIFPELTIFYCYSCHHSLTEDQWKSRDYGGRPGELLLNVSSLIIVREAMAILNPKLSSRLESGLSGLHVNYKNGINNDVASLRAAIAESWKIATTVKFSESDLNKLLARLVKYGGTGAANQYEVAEQVAMGISALAATMSEDGSAHKSEIEKIYAALKNPEEFRAEEFTEACKKFAL